MKILLSPVQIRKHTLHIFSFDTDMISIHLLYLTAFSVYPILYKRVKATTCLDLFQTLLNLVRSYFIRQLQTTCICPAVLKLCICKLGDLEDLMMSIDEMENLGIGYSYENRVWTVGSLLIHAIYWGISGFPILPLWWWPRRRSKILEWDKNFRWWFIVENEQVEKKLKNLKITF